MSQADDTLEVGAEIATYAVCVAGGLVVAHHLAFQWPDRWTLGFTAAGLALGVALPQLLDKDKKMTDVQKAASGIGGAAVGLLAIKSKRYWFD